MPQLLIKEENARMQVRNLVKVTNNYSRSIKLPKHLAPASTHKRDSLLILSKMTIGGVLLFLKTLALRSFQSSQVVRRAKEAIALRLGVAPSVNNNHHSWKGREVHELVSIVLRPNHSLMRSQILRERRQWTKR